MNAAYDLNKLLDDESDTADAVVEDKRPVEKVEKLTSLYDFIQNHTKKLINVNIIKTDTFVVVPTGKFLVFVTTKGDNDEDFVLLNTPNALWLGEDVGDDVESIVVEPSGVIIKTSTSSVYVMKNGTHIFTTDKYKRINRSKHKHKVKITTMNQIATGGDVNIDNVKLIIKTISGKIYDIIKDMDNVKDIRSAVIQFKNDVKDLNYLIKIEKSILMRFDEKSWYTLHE